MNDLEQEHRRISRRYFSRLFAGAGTVALLPGCRVEGNPQFAHTLAGMDYLTAQEMFGTVERGKPLPYKLPPAQLAEAGLTTKTWKLEVLADPEDPAVVDQELTIAGGTAFTYDALMRMAEHSAVRFLKTLTCANGAKPLGTGLWEGVPVREVIRQTGVSKNFRRMWYFGFHNHDPKQIFQSSLSADRLFEDPLQTPPVILAYRLNGEPLSGKRGGPVRLVVPEAYGFKSVKWLDRILLSNRSTSNDTYAKYNNTTESWMKSLARFGGAPGKVAPGTPIPVSGIAQVGTAGLERVEVLLKPADAEASQPHWREDKAWMEATLLEAPRFEWGGRLPDREHPGGRGRTPAAFGFSEDTRAPVQWPLRFTTAHWAAVLPPQRPGSYRAYCRTIDRDGRPQPWPRTLQNSGRNLLHRVPVEVG